MDLKRVKTQRRSIELCHLVIRLTLINRLFDYFGLKQVSLNESAKIRKKSRNSRRDSRQDRDFCKMHFRDPRRDRDFCKMIFRYRDKTETFVKWLSETETRPRWEIWTEKFEKSRPRREFIKNLCKTVFVYNTYTESEKRHINITLDDQFWNCDVCKKYPRGA